MFRIGGRRILAGIFGNQDAQKHIEPVSQAPDAQEPVAKRNFKIEFGEDAAENFKVAIDTFARLFDDLIHVEPRDKAAKKQAQGEDGHTQTLTEVTGNTHIKNVAVDLYGANAPVMARPLHSLIGGHFIKSKRHGQTGTTDYRAIQGTAYEYELQGAAETLKHFIETAKDMKNEIGETIELYRNLEDHMPCRVIIKFDLTEEGLVPRIDYIQTTPDSLIAQNVKNLKDVSVYEIGAWKESNLVAAYETGVAIRPATPEARALLTQVVRDTIIQALAVIEEQELQDNNEARQALGNGSSSSQARSGADSESDSSISSGPLVA